jgi:hypothetical protein
LDMATVTRMNLRWKQFRIAKPLEAVTRTTRREFYCLTFKISDFVSIPIVLSPLVTSTP